MKATEAKPTAVVSGATSGIGRAITERLAKEGHEVLAIGRNPEALNELESLNNVNPVSIDLSDQAALEASLKNKDFDVVINNAGIIPPTLPFHEMGQTDIDTTLATNINAAINLTRLVLPPMVARQSGHIFFTGSTAGQVPFPNMAIYGATKAAISSFAAALRCDLSGRGVRVTEIVAGRVETALYRNALDDEGRKSMYSAFESVQPENVAEMVMTVLKMPAHVDVTRFDILPTAQYVGGGGFARNQ